MMAMALVATLSLGLWHGAQHNSDKQDQTAISLDRARSALLAWSVAYFQQRGSGRRNRPTAKVTALPCPDLGNGFYAGSAAGVCGTRHHASLGMLPWRSLDLPPLYDASGSCLWYWVSGDYKSSPYPKQLNAIRPGGWVHDGGHWRYHQRHSADELLGKEHIAAIVFAPGQSLERQNRPSQHRDCRHIGDPREFLEAVDWQGLAATGATDKQHPVIASRHGGNDRMMLITHRQLWSSVLSNPFVSRLLSEEMPTSFARCLAAALADEPDLMLPSPLADLWLDDSCKHLYDRRARDLRAHWGQALVVIDKGDDGFAVGLSEQLRDAMASLGQLRPASPGTGGADSAPKWYCLRPGQDEPVLCASPPEDIGGDPDA